VCVYTAQNTGPGVAALLIGYSGTNSNLYPDPNLNADPIF